MAVCCWVSVLTRLCVAGSCLNGGWVCWEEGRAVLEGLEFVGVSLVGTEGLVDAGSLVVVELTGACVGWTTRAELVVGLLELGAGGGRFCWRLN